MEQDLQRNLENLGAYDMLKELKTVFSQQAEQELLQTVREFQACKQKEEQYVRSYVLKMKSYIDNLEHQGHPVSLSLANKVFVARNAEFFKNSLITQEASGSFEDLEIIQEEDTHPSENTSSHNDEGDQEIDEPQIDLPLNGKTVGSKWLFKKKTGMDGAIHIYKARLVAKDFTQTLGIDYKETFSFVADIRAIRILIAIFAFYDYEI
uniref:Zinc finger, CCHC-type n=1 Tax=Tanacetum cinerariifolium TaxID=118510 RepID=A0A699HUV1_TANCI|nr:zinc finger, CCHC-type [Tanacetum cinerariifolium]